MNPVVKRVSKAAGSQRSRNAAVSRGQIAHIRSVDQMLSAVEGDNDVLIRWTSAAAGQQQAFNQR